MGALIKPGQRRYEFDEAAQGWGADTLEDLKARAELLDELWTRLSGFTSAELKVRNAIAARIRTLEAAG